MPNWKKVIVSGSDAALNSLNVTTALTASGLIYPTLDGTANQVIQTDGLGNLSFGSVDTTYEVVKNVAGTTLYKGTPVHATASNALGNVVGIIAASASNPATMPATFILNEDLADEAEGYAIISGLIQGVDTSAFKEGDVVYVGENSGYTNVKPTGSNLIQNLGIVTKIHPSNGAGIVLGAGRSNDVPNLLSGEVFWGENNRSIQKPLAHILSGSSYIYSGSFSGSFEGDGSALTGIQVASLQSNFNVTSFTNTGSITINHNLNATYPLVQVYDNTNNQIIPDSVEVIDSNNVKISFVSQRTGNVVIGKGGDIIDLTQILPPTTRAVTGSFTSVTSTTITHNLATENILVSVYDNTKNYIIPDSIQILNENNVQIGFTSPTTGYAVVTNGGHIVSGSIDWTNVLNKPSGLVSSSAQISITESQISDLTHYTDSDVLDYLTTGVGGTVIPTTTEIYDLGSPTKRWRDLYLSGSTIYLGDTKLSRGDAGSLEVKDSNNNILPIVAKSIHIGDGTNMIEIKRDVTRGTVKFVESTMQQTGELISTSNIVIGTYSGSFTGSFVGDGSKLSGVTSYTDSDTLSYINTLGIISSSAQISSEISGAFFESANTILQNFYLNTNRLTDLESKTLISGSSQVSYTDVSNVPDGIISSSAQLSNATIPGDLTIDGVLTAQEFRTEFVSASIIYQSGSTKFGDTSDDTHTFLGTLSATTIQNVLSSSAQIDYDSIPNRVTNNNQLTNGAGYTTCVGDITGVTAGTGLSGGGTSGTVTVYHGNTSTLTGEQGTTGIASISVDSYGHVTAVTTAAYCTTDTDTTYTANDMLTCIKTVDGAGSGLDADTLDGNQASAFYLATNPSGYTSCTGTVTGTGTSGYISKWNGSTSQNNSIIYDDGTNLGIGTTSPSNKLHVAGAVSASTYYGDGSNLTGVTSYTDSDTLSYINTLGVVSSSAQLSVLSGSFSGSFVGDGSQLSGVTSYTDADTLIYINSISVVSGSSQITLSSATGNLTAARISDFDTEVSNNTSVTANTAKVGYTDALVKSKLNTESVLSGSITSAKIIDVDAFSQSGTYANLRAQGTTASDVGLGNVTNESKATMFTNAALTGNPTAPTQTGTDDSTKIATTAFVQDRIDSVIGTAGSALDTLGELSASLSNDQDSLAALTTTVGTKLAKSSNLSDLTNVATARTNLGLGTAATTNSTAYATAAQGTNADTAYGWGNHALAGYTSCTGDITGVTAGTGITGGGTSGTVTVSHADTSTLTGAQGSAGIASITVDALGHVTAVTTATYCTTDTNTTYTANDMLTCIKTVDGAGSGLDADTLDGNHASAFYLASNPSGYTSCTGTVSSWAGIPTGTRTNYTLKFQPPSNNYAGFQFLGTNSSNAGYFLIRGTSDSGGTYTAEGISLIADQGWLTLAQRTTSGKGVRILSNNAERLLVEFDGTVRPGANGTQNLGSSTYRWNTVYTSDLSLKNDIGDWTIVEGEEDLFLYNNKKDKVYKFNLTEVDKDSAPKKRS